MFANCSAGGTNFSAIDVCNTPSTTGTITITYTNTSMGSSASGASTVVFYGGSSAHNTSTSISSSNGDEAGVTGGVVSGTNMDSTRYVTGSSKVFVEGQPASRLTSTTLQNSSNGTGTTISPAQTTVLLLS